MLLREVEQRLGIIDSIVDCFRDYRDPDRIEFSVKELLNQQIMGLALGYEDLNNQVPSPPQFAAFSSWISIGGEVE